ncbi:VWA domain-containing protein [Agrobacterium rosae]|uniref:pilus assembly protein TadG-related protein n=1 Tax=Agrobacterium rosae TaxID=1972867 RepID=UPI0019D38FDF|nr:pilus assembly protein TadG-related protein [Agrobacterium rosae]MBN7808375.1 VWA domain-containing protein [Agrobacterium rosae]
MVRAVISACRNLICGIALPCRDFSNNKQGSFAVISAILLPCLIIMAGCALDLTRLMAAKKEAQGALDAAVLAAASSGKPEDYQLEKIVSEFLKGANVTMSENLTLERFVRTRAPNTVSASIRGRVPTTFMSLANIDEITISVFAEAKWATEQTIEVAMVLDNTWSMQGEKLAALKNAARDLVNTLENNKDPEGSLKVGLVPYADYVNVGLYNRFRPWIAVPDEYTTQRTCETVNTENVCERGNTRTCTKLVDGMAEKYDCTLYQCTTKPVRSYQRCTGGQEFSWHGCVGSRTSNKLRLNDLSPNVPYPGLLSATKNCLDPIVPLTANLNEVRIRINHMIVQIGSYKPSTYIPAGLIWGVNILSPTRPFSEGAAYDDENRMPHKALILMTDGANTMRFDQSTGTHLETSNAAELKQTDSDMQSICQYARSKKIEVYTVLFQVNDDSSNNGLLRCATSPRHSFDAKNSKELIKAFSDIAASLTSVTLTK